MATTVETVGFVLQGLAAIVYTVVAVFLARRPVSETARGAQRGFIVWWAGLAFLGVFGLIFNDVYGIDIAQFGLGPMLVILYALFAGIFALLAGLMYYLLFLYTGRRQALWVPVAYYALLMASLVWVVHGFGGACMVPDDSGCVQPDWQEGDPSTLGSYEERPGWVGSLFGIGLVLPPLVAAVMYFLLYYRVEDTTSKYRILMVSGGIILWFTFSLANSVASLASGDGSSTASALVSHLLGLLAAALVLLAYFPPRAVQRRFGVESLANQAQG